MQSNAAITPSQILRAASSIGMLGTGAQSASRVLALLCKPTVTAKQVAALVNQEPALCGRVLRVANSAYYGQSRAVSSVDRAMLVLGLDAVRGIAAAACMDRAVPRGTSDLLVDTNALLQHSLATATAAELLAKKHRPALAADAFIAGLLHNLGVIVQSHLDRPGIQSIVDLRKSEDTRDIRVLERELNMLGHEECIAVILETWQLPLALIDAARHHHNPMGASGSGRELASLINLGATLSLVSGNKLVLETTDGSPNAQAMDCLGLNITELERFAAKLVPRMASLGKALYD